MRLGEQATSEVLKPLIATKFIGIGLVSVLALSPIVSCDAPRTCPVSAGGCTELVAPRTDTVSVTVDPPEGGTTSINGGIFARGGAVTVSATANPQYHFLNWTTGHAVIGTAPSVSFGASNGLKVVAHFQSSTQYQVTVAGSGTGTVVADSSLICAITTGVATGACTARYYTSHTVILEAVPAPGNRIAGWTGNCSAHLAEDTTVVPPGGCALAPIPVGLPAPDQTVTATFVPAGDYVIATRVRAGDLGTAAGGAFPATSVASVVATPAPGWAFLYWTDVPGGIASGDSLYRFPATMTRLLEAAFTSSPTRYAISVSTNPPTGGAVTGGGIVASGRYVALVAAPAAGYRFANWADSTGAVIGTVPAYPGFLASANRRFTANFLPADGTATLSVAVSGTGGGRVTATPGPIDCSGLSATVSGQCVANFPMGATVALSAAPAAGSVFTGWTGDCAGTGTCALLMTTTRAVTAAFLPAGAPLDLTIDAAYLTQAVQNYAGTVPLVANRDALLRVFVKGSGANGAAPSVRARLSENGTLFATHIISAPAAGVPTTIDEGNLQASWNLTIPSSEVRPGLSLLVDVDPDATIGEANRANNSYPVSGFPIPLDVRARQSFDVTFVPVGRQGVFRTPGNIKTTNADAYLSPAIALWPIGASSSTVHPPYAFDGEPQQRCVDAAAPCILADLAAVRAIEGSTTYYYGVFAVNSAVASDVDGTAAMGGAVAAGSELGAGFTAAHAWGHNFGRNDAPCGAQPGNDPAYPYAGGVAGVFGYDTRTGTFHPSGTDSAPPAAPSFDIMSACIPNWVSDYSYTGAFAALAAPPPPLAAASPGILVWGRVTATGTAVLEPAFSIAAPPRLPTTAGTMVLRALDVTGQTLYDLSFDPVTEAHGGGADFAFVVPLNPAQPYPTAFQLLRGGAIVAERRAISNALGASGNASPAAITVAHTGAILTLAWNSGVAPAVMVRDAVTGEVLSIARGGGLLMYAPAAMQLAIEVTDGVQSFRQLVAVPP